MQVPQGVAGMLHARTLLGSCWWWRLWTWLDGLVHDLPNSLVDGATGNVLGGHGHCGCCCTTWENPLGGYSIEFESSVYGRPAESNCMKRFVGVNALIRSFVIHPCMRLHLYVSLMGRVVGSME